MTYHRPEWKFYTCQYVMSRRTESEPEKEEFYLNVVIFGADNPDEAYEVAVDRIEAHDYRYRDNNGVMTVLTCYGIRDIELLQARWNEIEEMAMEYGYDCCSVDIFEVDAPDKMIRARDQMSIFQEC